MTWIIVGAVLLAIFVSPLLLDPNRNQRRNAESADNLIAQAGSEYLRGMNDAALMHYRQARDIAGANGAYLLEAQGNDGMSQVYQRRGDFNSAAACLRAALANSSHWENYKPNYVSLLKSELAKVEAELKP